MSGLPLGHPGAQAPSSCGSPSLRVSSLGYLILLRVFTSSWQTKKERVVEHSGEVVMVRPTNSLYHFCLDGHMVTWSHLAAWDEEKGIF